ncbi:interferon gamma receptor 1-like isoform X1 [Scophthalmus maximus]|uniref:interferon gamma receptor 1-like isoform X1 n=1 Tax=Scophthalmus maximus TaxID=52904 RepID=UPI001FA8978B|nr:interferon gamma receptor 1-like isoform X1 [Scophthalmus maximus]
MDLAKRHPVFLLVVWLPAALGLVEQPSNVTLSCHNLRNTLEWSYEQLLPGLRFRVNIYAYNGPASVLWVEPPALQADVSSLSNPDNEYHMYVVAEIGHNESEPAPPDGISFSYFMDSGTSQKCSVDLPPVNVTAQPDDNVVFRFMHPWLLHGPRMPSSTVPQRRKKSHDAQSNQHLPVFKYGVVIVSQKQPHHFSCVQSVCEQKIPVEAAQGKHCLNITGELQKMAVKSTQLYCAMPLMGTPLEQTHYITYIVVGLTVVSVTVFVLFLIYKKMTSPGTALPKSILIGKHMEDTTGTFQEQIIVTKVEPSSPTPLLLHQEEEEFTPAATPAAEPPDLRLRIGVTQADDVCDVTEVGHPEEGGHLDEEETPNYEVPSGYEKREVLVEMGPDDLAEGYRA